MDPDTFQRVEVLGQSIVTVPPGDLGPVIARLSREACRAMYFCNVHMLMLAREDPELSMAMDSVDCVFADGAPVAWLQRRLSGHDNRVVRGYEVMTAVCERAAREEETIGLYGSTPDVLERLASALQARFPGLRIGLSLSPPMSEDSVISSESDLQQIEASGVDWLFVGLGCPKQEKWIANHKTRLNCRLLGVGAAFDWLAGTTPMPPEWMQRAGLGWLFRLLHNPRRMWRRYMIYNSKFLILTSVFLLRRALGKGEA